MNHRVDGLEKQVNSGNVTTTGEPSCRWLRNFAVPSHLSSNRSELIR
ncbi:hypothetical protein [Phocoenobacter atlanticus]